MTHRECAVGHVYGSAHDVEVPHHAGRVVLEDVAVVHPASRPIVGVPGNPNGRLRRHVDDVFQRSPCRLVAVDLENLEEESVQVKRVVHPCRVDHIPDLQFADLHWLVVMVALASMSVWFLVAASGRWIGFSG